MTARLSNSPLRAPLQKSGSQTELVSTRSAPLTTPLPSTLSTSPECLAVANRNNRRTSHRGFHYHFELQHKKWKNAPESAGKSFITSEEPSVCAKYCPESPCKAWRCSSPSSIPFETKPESSVSVSHQPTTENTFWFPQ